MIEVGLRSRSRGGGSIEYPEGSLHLHRTDGDGEWLLTTVDGELVATFEHARGDAAARGTASDLLLYLWGRGRTTLECFGDEALLDAWASVAPLGVLLSPFPGTGSGPGATTASPRSLFRDPSAPALRGSWHLHPKRASTIKLTDARFPHTEQRAPDPGDGAARQRDRPTGERQTAKRPRCRPAERRPARGRGGGAVGCEASACAGLNEFRCRHRRTDRDRRELVQLAANNADERQHFSRISTEVVDQCLRAAAQVCPPFFGGPVAELDPGFVVHAQAAGAGRGGRSS